MHFRMTLNPWYYMATSTCSEQVLFVVALYMSLKNVAHTDMKAALMSESGEGQI